MLLDSFEVKHNNIINVKKGGIGRYLRKVVQWILLEGLTLYSISYIEERETPATIGIKEKNVFCGCVFPNHKRDKRTVNRGAVAWI